MARPGPQGNDWTVEQGRARQSRALQSLLSRSGYGVTRSHKRGGNVTSGSDCNVANGIDMQCSASFTTALANFAGANGAGSAEGMGEQRKAEHGTARSLSHRCREHSLHQTGSRLHETEAPIDTACASAGVLLPGWGKGRIRATRVRQCRRGETLLFWHK